MLEEKIKKFLEIEIGSGSGYGFGSGSGNGYDGGSGDGFGSGSGNGYDGGSGDGSGCGSGCDYSYGYSDGSSYGSGCDYGDSLKSILNKTIYKIDGVCTIFEHINKNIAKGKIVNEDFTTENCYIIKGNNMFAHGETIKKAMQALQEKIYDNLDVDEAIAKFKEKFKQKNRKYKASDFYLWHHILTGSCEQGRNNFCKNNGIDLENGKYTVLEFIKITENSYCGDIIKRLKEYYN